MSYQILDQTYNRTLDLYKNINQIKLHHFLRSKFLDRTCFEILELKFKTKYFTYIEIELNKV